MNINNYKQDEEKTNFSWKNMRRMVEYVKPYKKEIIFMMLLGICSSIFLLFIPKIISYAIDVSLKKKDFTEIVMLTILMLLLVIISIFLTKLRRNKMNVVLNKVTNDMKVSIFEKLQYLPNFYFDTKSHGKIYTRATSYPDDVSVIFCYILVEIILDIINLVFVIIFMFNTNVKLSLASLFFSGILILFFIFISPLRRKLQHIANDKQSNVNAFLSENINGIRITQSFNREKKNESILKKLETDRMNARKNTLFVGNLSWSLTGIFDAISMIIIYYIGLKYMYPAISIGTIIAVDSYSSRFWEPISYLTDSYNDLMDASTYLERIFELLDEPLVITNSKNAKKVNIKGNVTFKNVKFGYDENKMVLSNLNFTIKNGQKVGIVGPTGCGKSTILNLISRFYDVLDGEILIDNTNIKDIELENLRGQVSIMLQDNFLFERSVFDNLVLDKKVSLKEVQNVCQMLGIHNIILSLENGYDTILLNNGSNLSNGERQLLCLARIMIQNPKILILDEATSNVDLKTEKLIENAMNIVTKKRTTIIVAHRLSTIKNADLILVMNDGNIIEQGTHEELMKQKSFYEKLYNSQFEYIG